jgi:hypothetical protein
MPYQPGQFFDFRTGYPYLLPPTFLWTCPPCADFTHHGVYAVDDDGVQVELTVCLACGHITRASRV